MGSERKSNPFRIIPEGEAKCIWMMAGVVSYKLCDHSYQCETCPLHIELSNVEADQQIPQSAFSEAQSGSTQNMREPLFFHPNHVWAQVKGPGHVIVGLDDFIARLLSKIKCIVLPSPENELAMGEVMATVFQDENSFPIVCPISGRVRTVNWRLMEDPNLMIEEPMDRGWIAVITPKNLQIELGQLLTSKEILRWRQEEIQKLETLIGTLETEERRSLGPVMHDGKPRLDSLLQIVGPRKYYRIVTSFMQSGTDQNDT